ncbi:MAG: hypothetical protein KGL43_06200 [Burkholderiales bacterium]|nr:hypothetical protein [Burkholderiales bacterium]
MPLVLFASLAAAADCSGPPVPALQPLAPEVWLVPGAPAASGPENHGKTSHQLLAREGGRLWLIGAGPTPAYARALDCRLRQRFGHGATDVVVPWPHGEQALGASGYAGARLWVHSDVAATMEHQCPACAEALRAALGPAAAELGAAPVAIPDRRFEGASGELGPWRWWRLWRGEGQPVTLWRLRATPLYFAPGLVWQGGAPDSRLADVERLRASTHELVQIGAPDGAAARWVGEQGDPGDASTPARQATYWDALQAAVDAAFERGEMLDKPPPLAGVAPEALADPRHALNWQRAWRQAEDRFLQAPEKGRQ